MTLMEWVALKFVKHEIKKYAKEISMGNTSWQTTVCGILAAAGTGLMGVKDPAWVGTIGQIMAAIGTAGLGLAARDNNKSSEQVGAGNTGGK